MTPTSVVALSVSRLVLVVCASVLLVGVVLMLKAVVWWLWVVWLSGVAVEVSRCLVVVSVGDVPVEGLWVEIGRAHV